MNAGGLLTAGFEDIDSVRWLEALSILRHDVYHLPSYVGFAARRQEVGAPLAFVAEQDGRWFFVPLIVRRIPESLGIGSDPLYDATCPRGYPGPLVQTDPGPDGEAFVDRATAALCAQLRERSIITAYMRLHPLLLPSLAPLRRAGVVVDHGASVSIDLSLSRQDMWLQTRHNHRRDINRAVREGFVARIDEAWQRFDQFIDLYAQSLERLGGDTFWRLSREYFDDLRDSLGRQSRLCVVEIRGEVAAAAIVTEVDGIVEYHLAGTADARVSASPSKLIVDFVRGWAKERGNRVFHLAGSLRAGDSLDHFKAGFSKRRHPIYSWRVVADPAAYGRLVERRDALEGSPVSLGSEAYFPAYRGPRGESA